MLDLTVLIDNNAAFLDKELLTEHGLSFYFKVDGLACLYDLGASDKWLNNANKLGIHAEEVDHLILSHGHKDHTGGLSTFLQVNKSAKIFVSDKAFKYKYLTYRHEKPRDISSDSSLFAKYADRFVLLTEDCLLSPHVYLIYNRVFEHRLPVGNQFLRIVADGQEKPYIPNDEVALVIRIDDGIVILSACSHSGVLNIIQSSVEITGCSKVLAFVGGTHLVDTDMEEKDDVASIARVLADKYPEMCLYTGHCTGSAAVDVFSEVLQNRFALFHSGMQLKF
ncbi:MAG: MBL fold metallo-hydrolase [Bacteroides graminisolvens]